jgi:methylated-DNA-protein-cysteine methyltransferase related protein
MPAESSTREKKKSTRRSAAPVAALRSDAERIYEVVRAIPRGRVATYGQVAELAGIPRGHRSAARALRSCPANLPWQRVLAKKDARRAMISIPDPEHAREQRRLLAREGIRFDTQGCIALRDFGWLPGEPGSARRK